jgi:hypothetical protein
MNVNKFYHELIMKQLLKVYQVEIFLNEKTKLNFVFVQYFLMKIHKNQLKLFNHLTIELLYVNKMVYN